MPIQKVLDSGRVPVKIWTRDIEPEAEKQLLNMATLPFVFHHVAVMPDVHAGKGSTIGSVIATRGAISPCTVSVDLGCGMSAVKLAVNPQKLMDNVKDIRNSIERSIPLGMNRNQRVSTEILDMPLFQQDVPTMDMDLRQSATKQLGSLGSGNHFVELCLDTQGDPWVMLHSGSRGVGNKLAMRFIDKAKKLMDTYFIKLADPDLAYLSAGTAEFDDYMKVVNWAQEFAFENRNEMMRRVLKDIAYEVNGGVPVEKLMEVNCHHNYVATEHHFGQNVMVTRKGAVRARKGDMGIIPGSMGTGSFIVRGLGNEESFCSCSHGAGRKMSRTKAKATFTVADLAEQTKGVECRKDKEVLDEIPGAYKRIEDVMKDQSDLVEVVAELKQVICIKG